MFLYNDGKEPREHTLSIGLIEFGLESFGASAVERKIGKFSLGQWSHRGDGHFKRIEEYWKFFHFRNQ